MGRQPRIEAALIETISVADRFRTEIRLSGCAHGLTLEVVALDLFGERPFVDLGWPVIDPEGPDLTEDLFDDGVPTDAGAAHDLNAAGGGSEEAIGDGYLRHGAFRG